MPRFAHHFEAAADTLNAWYQAVAEVNLDGLMGLWIDEEFVSCICPDGAHLYGLPNIRAGLAAQFEAAPVSIEPLDIRVYDSLGTVVYAIVEAHRPVDPKAVPAMVFTTYVMVHERGEWRIAHIHSSRMPDEAASQFSAKLRRSLGALH
ncbi:nuclear transport factor 2 family protein [Paraburkholderia sp.]|uniref:nuclear transport factor 2 family protein n=1 Tax=Paraburkholderia sp. TaxID=1926495 RepID=UPI0025CF2A5D|nr:nuclear transport factor 2 family protein [Paraburkholderia sp.]